MRTVEIEASKKKVLELFEDISFQLSINSKLKSLEELVEITPDARITHQITKGFFIVNGREFYTFAKKYEINKNTTIISNHSVESDDFPYIKKVTRASVRGIFLFERINSNLTRITNLLNVDLKGQIPGFVSNKAADAMYDAFVLLKKKMEQRLS